MTYSSSALVASTLAIGLAGPVLADFSLPTPYVSQALDAVLIPIDDDVRDSFQLYPDDDGVLVLAVAPGGVADAYGILPGDVLALEVTSDPAEIDEWVYYWITTGISGFEFYIWRDGGWDTTYFEITEDVYWSGTDITTVSTWESWSYESWSYEEYVVSYSEEITMVWEESETTIIEVTSSEEFLAEVEYYEEVTEEVTEEEMVEEETVEEEMVEEEVVEEEVFEEEAIEEEMVEEEAVEEEVFEEEAIEEEMVEEEAAEEEMVEEEAVEEEVFEEEAVEEGGDDTGE